MKNEMNSKNEKIFGTVCSAPELKVTGSGRQYASCRVLSFVKEDAGNGEVRTLKVWHNLVAWGKTAMFLQRNFTVGRKVAVACQEHRYQLQGKDGSTIEKLEHTVKKVLHLGTPKMEVIKIAADC